MLSIVHNGAVAIRNGANRGLRTRYLIHSLSHKKRKHRNFDAFFFGGKRWIRLIAERASTCISGASAPKQVVQAQRAARIYPCRYTLPTKKTTPHCDVVFWWEEVDSNHRRRCQQIYSLLPLATRESSHAWSWWSESNQQPADYKSAALPLSHTSEVFGTNTLCRTIHNKNGALGRS